MAMQNLMGDLANDDTVILLRRIVKELEVSANADAGNRQRVNIDSISTGLTLAVVTTVSTVSSVTNVAAVGGLDHRQFIDQARAAYNTGIRAGLIFS